MKHYVVIGATSAIAQACMKLWAAEAPIRLTLVGRDQKRLQNLSDDLLVRFPQIATSILVAEFETASGIQTAVNLCASLAQIDVALVAHGVLSVQSECEVDPQTSFRTMIVNGVSPVLFAEAIVQKMIERGVGTLGVIGSVAGDRGRKTNYVYGSAKGMVERYVEGLQHRLANTALKVVLIKPGPTDTPMTVELKSQGRRMTSVDRVASDIVRGMYGGQRVIYTPGIWRYIMRVICSMPFFIFNKFNI